MTARATILVLAGLLAACGTGPTGTLVDACPANVTTGTLEPLGSDVGYFDGARHLEIDWRDGFSFSTVGDQVLVIDSLGRTIARTGDRVVLYGGEVRPGCGSPAGSRSGSSIRPELVSRGGAPRARPPSPRDGPATTRSRRR